MLALSGAWGYYDSTVGDILEYLNRFIFGDLKGGVDPNNSFMRYDGITLRCLAI